MPRELLLKLSCDYDAALQRVYYASSLGLFMFVPRASEAAKDVHPASARGFFRQNVGGPRVSELYGDVVARLGKKRARTSITDGPPTSRPPRRRRNKLPPIDSCAPLVRTRAVP